MDTNLLSMSQQFSGLPMESLIGGPLNAAAKANSAMALTQTRFMLDTCFNRKEVSTTEPKSYQYEPIMIDMILTRSVIGPGATEGADPVIKPASTKFTLPLLTILPINSLAVETVDINFEMEVKSSFSEDDNKAKESESKGEGSFETKLGWDHCLYLLKDRPAILQRILRLIIRIMRRVILLSILLMYMQVSFHFLKE